MPDAVKRVRLSEAKLVVEALNAALDLEGGAAQRVELLLDSFRRLLSRDDASCALLLLQELDRQPGPRVIQQYRRFSSLSVTPPRKLSETQDLEDQCAPLHEILLAHVLAHPRAPTTVICSSDVDQEWFNDVLRPQLLEPGAYLDVMVSAWAASPDRRLDLVVFRHRPDPPFHDADRDLANLMLSGVGPLVDRELFRGGDVFDRYRLTTRQKDVLRLLLCGDSEKEIAGQLHRSLHTIHGHVKQIYRIFDVQNRGELMAMFVDRRILDSLEVLPESA
jgi:DNA-binding CsgD family transcriptional regulator